MEPACSNKEVYLRITPPLQKLLVKTHSLTNLAVHFVGFQNHMDGELIKTFLRTLGNLRTLVKSLAKDKNPRSTLEDLKTNRPQKDSKSNQLKEEPKSDLSLKEDPKSNRSWEDLNINHSQEEPKNRLQVDLKTDHLKDDSKTNLSREDLKSYRLQDDPKANISLKEDPETNRSQEDSRTQIKSLLEGGSKIKPITGRFKNNSFSRRPKIKPLP